MQDRNGVVVMEKKYELTNESIEIRGCILYRIQALRSFGYIRKGTLGGFIAHEDNLSHEGNAWVYDDAKIYDGARVFDDAKVLGGAEVFGHARIYGSAEVCGRAKIYGNASVYGDASVYAGSVYEDASVFGNVRVSGDVSVFGHAIVTKPVVYIGGLRFSVTITDNVVLIGCQVNTLEDWLKMSEEELEELDPSAIGFYEQYKNLIKTLAEEHQKTLDF